jgi:hypothetical protein
MRLLNPYGNKAMWFKGNTHVHTTVSDGDSSLDAVATAYRSDGYDFMAVTDHNRVGSYLSRDDGLLVLSGAEVSITDRIHICAIGVQSEVDGGLGIAGVVEAIQRQNGFAIINHPIYSDMQPDTAALLDTTYAVEIFNSVCQYLDYTGYALKFWDDLLSRGCRVWGIAADDLHRLNHHRNCGWLEVNADKLTDGAILDSLNSGAFYSSTGVRLHAIAVEGDRLIVESDPCIALRVRNASRKPLHRLQGEDLTRLEYPIRGDEGYLRIDAINTRWESAWTNPILFG